MSAIDAPAFPRFVPEGHYNGSVDEPGMTLRDWFAGQALAGLASRADRDPTLDGGLISAGAYALADAMLKERSTWS